MLGLHRFNEAAIRGREIAPSPEPPPQDSPVGIRYDHDLGRAVVRPPVLAAPRTDGGCGLKKGRGEGER